MMQVPNTKNTHAAGLKAPKLRSYFWIIILHDVEIGQVGATMHDGIILGSHHYLVEY
jgi:hypothetical protein